MPTFDNPFLNVGNVDLKRGGDVSVREILADVLERERSERQKPDFVLELVAV